jgi:hypothetical protein
VVHLTYADLTAPFQSDHQTRNAGRGELDLEELVTRLDEIDAPSNEKTFFEKTSNGWRPLKKAA